MTHRPKSAFLNVMVERGYLADCTDLPALDEADATLLADVLQSWQADRPALAAE